MLGDRELGQIAVTSKHQTDRCMHGSRSGTSWYHAREASIFFLPPNRVSDRWLPLQSLNAQFFEVVDANGVVMPLSFRNPSERSVCRFSVAVGICLHSSWVGEFTS